ncbi:MAG TPA: putative O-glycosylation ligase, exosortase A system-associated [Allosphingosinicella sp.]
MRDLALVAFLVLLLGFGLRRPFLLVLGYVYIDIVSPQRLSYNLLTSIPISQIFFLAAFLGWLIRDDKKGLRVAPRQWLLCFLLAWVAFTTFTADFPVEALEKWDWAWKALVFAIFLPFTLRTKLRLETLLLLMTLSAATIIIIGGIKTILSGGGYGVLNLGVDNNSGLYESSIISTLAIGLIPIILYLRKYGTIFPTDWRVNAFAGALIFACLLMPIGTEARTGLVCMAVLGVLMLRDNKRRFLYMAGTAFALMVSIPFLPASFTQRMDTIEGYQGDESASTRIAVWAWTWNYVQEHPLGGGFEAYRGNKISFQTTGTKAAGNVEVVVAANLTDEGRAYHSSYFEMLGEQGWPGFLAWLALHATGLVRMEILRRRYRRSEGREAWIAPLATTLQHSHIIYLIGSLFVGIAFQSFVYMWMAIEIGLDAYCRKLGTGEAKSGWGKTRLQPTKAIAKPA